MWSPKVSKNGKLNPFYEFMREVAPGDLIFSFADTRIRAVGIALSPCYDCPKPEEFGPAGRVWGDAGWRVDVRWRELREQIKPKDHMEFLSPFLPAKYSPLQATGSGLQGIYLTELRTAWRMHWFKSLAGRLPRPGKLRGPMCRTSLIPDRRRRPRRSGKRIWLNAWNRTRRFQSRRSGR